MVSYRLRSLRVLGLQEFLGASGYRPQWFRARRFRVWRFRGLGFKVWG